MINFAPLDLGGAVPPRDAGIQNELAKVRLQSNAPHSGQQSSRVNFFFSETDILARLFCMCHHSWDKSWSSRSTSQGQKSSRGSASLSLLPEVGAEVLSLQDCTPSCLLKGDLSSSHFTPGIKSAHTQTYTHKVENIRPHSYIIAHSSLINHEKKLHARNFQGDYCFLNRLNIARIYGVKTCYYR